LKYYGETLLNNECTLKNKRQKFKTDPVRGWVLVAGGEWMEKAKRANMVDVLYIIAWKQNNETCWNCFKKEEAEGEWCRQWI
jgi:hypothetical protein